jgi:2-dehydro-3-deoxyphosphooctonate aldolase (KDO 8-P synthase)
MAGAEPHHVTVHPGLRLGNDLPLVLIAGPCQIESRAHARKLAGHLVEMAEKAGIGLIFKASFDKANRSSAGAARGVGIDEGLDILAGIRSDMSCAVLTDIHEPAQAALAAGAVDILQIPAFLCRQTDLLVAAARTGCVVNIKKGQFAAPGDMMHAAAKVTGEGNEKVCLTERGTSFGYHDLVVDYRGLGQMAATGHPVIMDVTHAVQSPGGLGGSTGGNRAMVPVLARAAVACGVAGIFIETHEDPDRAPSDAANMVPLDQMPALIADLMVFDQLAKSRPLPLLQAT